jgi:drug/metabolite transporter (DMT)-like permease
MQAWLPIIIYGTTVALGLVLGWYFLNGKRPSQGLQALHFVLGFGGLEVVMIITSRSSGDPDLKQNASIALIMLGLTAVIGLFAGILAKSRPEGMGPVLAAHAFVGGAAFLVLANWTLHAIP